MQVTSKQTSLQSRQHVYLQCFGITSKKFALCKNQDHNANAKFKPLCRFNEFQSTLTHSLTHQHSHKISRVIFHVRLFQMPISRNKQIQRCIYHLQILSITFQFGFEFCPCSQSTCEFKCLTCRLTNAHTQRGGGGANN